MYIRAANKLAFKEIRTCFKFKCSQNFRNSKEKQERLINSSFSNSEKRYKATLQAQAVRIGLLMNNVGKLYLISPVVNRGKC